MKKITAISLTSVFLMSGCAVHNGEASIGEFGLTYESDIRRKLDNQYYTEAGASLAGGRISGAENIIKNDAAHFCVTQDEKMWIVNLKTEGTGLHGVARLTFKYGEWEQIQDYHAHIYFICDRIFFNTIIECE